MHIPNNNSDEFMSGYDNVIIVFPYSVSEISTSSFGGSRLISELNSYLERNGKKVSLLSLEDGRSFTSALYRLTGYLRRRSAVTNSASEKNRWLLNLLFSLFADYVSRLDILNTLRLKCFFTNTTTKTALIYNFPYGFRSLASAARSDRIQLVVYEHNVEWKFLEDKLDGNTLTKFLIDLAKGIELRSLNEADHIICLSSNDKDILVREGVPDEKVNIFVPMPKQSSKPMGVIPPLLREKLKDSFVIGFVGTNFKSNIASAYRIIQIAESNSDVSFLIIGAISKAFHEKVPHNVIFTGYVQNLDDYLSVCDAFINPKSDSDTGIEIKMFDYLKFNKPILSTEIGARGFEFSKNVILCSLDEISDKIKILSKGVVRNGKISRE